MQSIIRSILHKASQEREWLDIAPKIRLLADHLKAMALISLETGLLAPGEKACINGSRKIDATKKRTKTKGINRLSTY